MTFLFIFICLIVSAFFAGMETGFVSADSILLLERRRKGVFYARAYHYLMQKPDRLLGTTLIGYNIANVTAAVLLTVFMRERGWESLTWLGILIMTFFFLILNDIVPKSFFRRNANTLAVRLAPILLVFYLLFLPVYLILNSIVKILLFISGQHVSRREELKSKRDIRLMINLAGRDVGLPSEDQQVIEDIFDFRDQAAREVMIPFHNLPVIGVHGSVEEVARLSIESGYRFIVVSEGRTDNIVGYVDSLDLIWEKKTTTQKIMQEPVFYPETRLIPDLLLEMNRRDLEVAFLTNEHGGVVGMITPSQIVGDLFPYIPEEGSQEEDITKLDDGSYLVDGTTDLEDLSHEIGVQLRKGYNSTVGGYLCEKLGIIPKVNDEYREADFVFKVLESDARHVSKIEIRRDN